MKTFTKVLYICDEPIWSAWMEDDNGDAVRVITGAKSEAEAIEKLNRETPNGYTS